MTDRIALITGASRGFGAAIAKALAPAFHIVAVARTVGALEELDDAIQAKGGQATLAPMDVTVDAAMQQLCRGIHDRWGRLDLWVHTAIHAGPLAPASHIAPKDFASSLDVNVTATQRLMSYVAPLLGTAGHAVFCDDDVVGQKFYGTYGATKAAQLALVRSWQAETARTGPRVTLVAPAPMPTALRARFFPGEDRSALTPPEDEALRLLDAIRG
ncbi:NADP-dependent 3-hydroxy acid dehydrogenase YdfG [Loktanella atrilutea]|uniref:NADP-dependent 3-hydroxy acid dehydrogenase YdfG n=1 Tax=Loktanella atrilutea TaxID=366533 RepID=A0A1M4U5V2_LOKAT|nr:SDR family NAD(P)-dependent oxidoreductase [Loktanella atrilutea]SHE52201.1 NADP-dependent 3-hydroxy acid dehydrogenase YdfG [Loktanella atrilutea]